MSLFNTFDDMGVVPAQKSWTALRALRATPPARASGGARKSVFVAALEQAEQLFAAASAVGTATKPILVFYGLSQAGRAVTAAMRTGNPWQIHGHGLTGDRGGARTDSRLADLTVTPDGGGLFAAVGDVLGSSLGTDPITVGQLWPLAAAPGAHPLPHAGPLGPLSVYVDQAAWAQGNPTVQIGEIPAARIGVVEAVRAVGPYGATYNDHNEAVDKLLADYPTLSGRKPHRYQGLPLGLQGDGDTCSLSFGWQPEVTRQHRSVQSFTASIGVPSRGEWRVYPRLTPGGPAVHPFLAWWAVLFRLSLLARYEPQTWERVTAVNRSADAVPVESVLDTALTTVPELLVHQLAAPGPGTA